MIVEKKYLLYPGHVRSKNDGDWHYISASKLAALYKVSMQECIVVKHTDDWFSVFETDDEYPDLIKLFVKWNGDYIIPENKP